MHPRAGVVRVPMQTAICREPKLIIVK